MAKSKLDLTGTAAAAAARGVSRRTIQRERKRLLDQSEAIVERSKPIQLTLDGVEAPPIEWPDELPPDPLDAQARAGAVETALYLRLRQAVEAGDPASTKLFTSAWADVWKVLARIEPLALQRLGQLRNRLSERLEITQNFAEVLATHGPAYIRANMPSPSEVKESCTPPATDEEIERWNRRIDELERERLAEAAAATATPPRTPGPCEKEILEKMRCE